MEKKHSTPNYLEIQNLLKETEQMQIMGGRQLPPETSNIKIYIQKECKNRFSNCKIYCGRD